MCNLRKSIYRLLRGVRPLSENEGRTEDSMPALGVAEIASRLATLSAWQLDGDEIHKTYHFDDFGGSMSFVNKVAERAEAVDHHPDIEIKYNEVSLALSTHSEGGLTEKDFALAHQIDEIG